MGNISFRMNSESPRPKLASIDTTIQRQAHGLSESRIVLYKKGHKIEPRDFYIVEISTESDSLYIAAYSVTSSESFLIHQKGQQAQNTILRFGYDFSMMAMCLSFNGNRLVLKSTRTLLTRPTRTGESSEPEVQLTSINIRSADRAESRKLEARGGRRRDTQEPRQAESDKYSAPVSSNMNSRFTVSKNQSSYSQGPQS